MISFGLLFPSGMNKNMNYPLGGNGYMNSRIKDIPLNQNCDVLILGSSHAYRSFDPRIFSRYHINSFNLGSSSQTPIETELLVNKYIDLLKPKTVIYEVYPVTFTEDGVESALDLLANDALDINTLKMVFKLNQIKVYNTFLYACFRQLFFLNNSFSEPIKKGDDTYIEGGFVEKKLSYYHQSELPKISKIIFNQNQVIAFENTVSKMQQKGIKVILVQAPITHQLHHSFLNRNEIDNYFHSKDEGYYNYNGLNLSDEYFYDADHLNQNGVEVFNKKLIEHLKLK
jgi:hypothetical protein